MKTLNVVIAEDGSVKIDALGFKGKACEKMTAELAKALGTPGESKKKPEYWQAEVKQQQKVGG